MRVLCEIALVGKIFSRRGAKSQRFVKWVKGCWLNEIAFIDKIFSRGGAKSQSKEREGLKKVGLNLRDTVLVIYFFTH